jgi:Family of unknown function (DUF6599)
MHGDQRAARQSETSMKLPQIFGPWTRPDAPRRIDAESIFLYMDGGGELYLAYRFDHLDVFEYGSSDQGNILVELYWMQTSDDAFGLLSGDWGGEPVVLEDEAAASTMSPSPVPPHRALYGAGLLRVWSDTLYARVLASRETAASREQVLAIGRAIAAGRRQPPFPALTNALPATAGTTYRLRPDRTTYLRSHLVLNSVYFLSPENILNLDRATEAAMATYESSIPAPPRHQVRLLLVRYRDEAVARAAAARFRDAYFPEARERVGSGPDVSSTLQHVEDGWAGYQRKGRCLAVVFEFQDPELARTFVRQASERLAKLEAAHE